MNRIYRKNIFVKILPFFMFFIISMFGIAFASIENITGTITGTMSSKVQDGIFITGIELYQHNGAELENTKINTYHQRTINSITQLSNTDGSSYVTYRVKLYNNTNYRYSLDGIGYDLLFFDNEDIECIIDSQGMQIGGIFEPKTENEVYITFKYKNGTVAASQTLNSVVNIEVELLKPTIEIECINSEEYTSTKGITITAKDNSLIGLSAENEYEYYLSTSQTELVGGSWTAYTSGVEQSIGSGLTGTYYMFIKQIADTVGQNSITGNETAYHIYGPYNFDNEAPMITLESDTNTTWSKTASVTVTLSDSRTGLASGNSIKYGWSTSNTTEPEAYTTATIDYSKGDTTTTFTANASGLTGKYYLWVVPETFKDMAGNNNTTAIQSTGTFYMDNTAPVIGSVTGSTATGNTGTVSGSSISDSESGIKGYYVSTNSTEPTVESSWTDSATESFSATVSEYGTYYAWVIDNAGNISSVKSCTVSGIVAKVNITGYTGITLLVGNTGTPSLTFSGTPKSKAFSSSDTSIATINSSSGLVKGIKAGTATMTATLTNYDGTTVSETCTVTVKNGNVMITATGVHYNTLNAAISAAAAGNTLQLVQSYTDNSTATISKNLTLNTNGKTLTKTSSTITVNSGYTLSVSGSGTITNSSSMNTITNKGTLKLASATITFGGSSASYAAVRSTGTFTMSSGTVSATSGGKGLYVSGGTGTVSGGTISGSSTWAVYVSGKAKVTMTGATVKGTYGAKLLRYNETSSETGGERLMLIDCTYSGVSYIQGYVITVDAITGGYRVKFFDTANLTPSAKFYTWTSNNGQDDMTTQLGVTGTFYNSRALYLNVYKSAHNNESGTYNTHIYTEDGDGTVGNGTYYFIDGFSYTL